MSKKKQIRSYLQCAVPGERADTTGKYMPLPNSSREYTQTKMSFAGLDRTHPFSMSSEARNVVFESGVPVSVSIGELLRKYDSVESVHGFKDFILVFYSSYVKTEFDDDGNAKSIINGRFIDYIIPKDEYASKKVDKIPVKGADDNGIYSYEYDGKYDWAPPETATVSGNPDEDITFTSFETYGLSKEPEEHFPQYLPAIQDGYSGSGKWTHGSVDNHEYSEEVDTGKRLYTVVTKQAEYGGSGPRTAVLFNTAEDTKVVTDIKFSQSILVFPDKIRIWLEDGKLNSEQLGDDYPDLDTAVAFNGRLYGGDDKGTIYVSKYNRCYDANDGKGNGWELDTSTDISSSNAWICHTQTNPLSGTEIMAVVPYASRIFALKTGMTYTIYGTENPFRVRETIEKGTVDLRSVCVVSDILFFLAQDGVYTFDSSSLTRISDVLGISEFDSGIAATVNGRYYLYTKGELFVYDTSNKSWSTIDTDGVITGLATTKNELYAIYSDGRLVRLVSQTNLQCSDFSVTTAGLIGNTLADRRIKELNLICNAVEESDIHISAILSGADGHTYEKKIGSIYRKRGLFKKRYRVNLPAAMFEKIKISGRGRVRIIALDVSHTFTI